MKQKFSQYPTSTQFAIIVGVALILFGSIRLIGAALGFGWLEAFQRFVVDIFGFIWPLALIVAGVYLVWAGKAGRLRAVKSIDWDRPFGRSSTDKRLMGVCGGIAEFIGIDPTIVRILVLILLVAAPMVVIPAYLIAGVVLPYR